MFDLFKGVLLLGVQGCGKSLVVKVIVGGFGVLLVWLDFGMLYNKYQGEMEKNLCEVLVSIELLSFCVLWIDEIEKGLVSGGGEDGGVLCCVFGYLFIWMVECKVKVFVVVIVNVVYELFVELLCKGCFDEIFFVDLFIVLVCVQIFQLYLECWKLLLVDFDLFVLVVVSEGFFGVEIEQVIVSVFYDVVGVGVLLDQMYLFVVLVQMCLLLVLMCEQVDVLCVWVQGCCVLVD